MIGDKRRIGNFEHLPHMSFEDFKVIAIHELDPHGRFTIEDWVMTWDKINVNPKPSDEDIEAKATELQKLHADLEYSRIRTKGKSAEYTTTTTKDKDGIETTTTVVKEEAKTPYPTIGEQLDLLWHAIDEGTLDKTSEFYTTLKKVKDDNPKP